MRAKVFILENELDRLKVEVSEKDQLSEQVNCKLLLLSVYSSSVSFIIFSYTFVRNSRKCIPNKIEIP